MTVYYNEIDPYAAQWLRNLIAAGHLAKGEVDERSITEIQPDDLLGFNQCHFFAGIGVWGYALRQAGWADDRPVWTGSCPCQPFSAAGKQEGFADERHLWPTWFNLISQCRPAIVLGEQVASALDWLDLVSTDMESAGYAFGAADLCAAGFGGAHIRQRLYFAGVANAAGERHDRLDTLLRPQTARRIARTLQQAAGGCASGGVANADNTRPQGRGRVSERASERAAGTCGLDGGLADADHNERRQVNTNTGRRGKGSGAEGLDERSGYGGDERIGLADAKCFGREVEVFHNGSSGETNSKRKADQSGVRQPVGGAAAHAPMLGRDAADWLYCRDDKWRPVEPGTFPLADAAASRVGRLRAYGNGLDAETATQFVAAVMDCAP